ncbi:MAG: hypothetical protein ACYDC1_24780 [Limisphaerales bacterium]
MSEASSSSEFTTTLVSFILGGVASFSATLVAERLKRPSLVFEITEPNDVDYSKGPQRPAKSARFLHIRVKNEELGVGLRWLGRSAAMFCQGKIDFKKQSGELLFAQSMPLRWSGTPEPVPMQVQIGGATGQIVDHFRYHLEQKVDIPAGESRVMDVAAQFDAELECYGWSNESYSFQPRWRNPTRKIVPGVYRVEVTLHHLGGRSTFACELVNEGGKSHLRKMA